MLRPEEVYRTADASQGLEDPPEICLKYALVPKSCLQHTHQGGRLVAGGGCTTTHGPNTLQLRTWQMCPCAEVQVGIPNPPQPRIEDTMGSNRASWGHGRAGHPLMALKIPITINQPHL